MAINIIGKPDKYSPVFNPIYYYMDSTNKTEEGFKYLVDVYSADTADKINRYSIFPRPVDGVGVADINQVLKSQIGCYINQNLNVIETAEENYFNYDVVFSEQYLYKWPFYDNYAASGLTLGLYSENATHYFEVGDFVNVVQNSGATNPQYNGVHKVTNVGYNFIELDTDFLLSSPVNSGYVTIANQTPTQFISPREVLYNNLLYSGTSANFLNINNVNGWTSYEDGCGNYLKIFNQNIVMEVVDTTCLPLSITMTETITNTATTLTEGVTYRVEFKGIPNSTDPTPSLRQVQANVGGTLGTLHQWSGTIETFSEDIICGTGDTFSLTLSVTAPNTPTDSYQLFLDNVSVKELAEVKNYTAFNSAIKHQDLLTYTSSTYLIEGNTDQSIKFLSGVPYEYKIRPENKMWLNALVGDDNILYYQAIYTRYGEYINNNPFVYSASTAQQNNTIQICPFGPLNITEIAGTQIPDLGGPLYWSNESGSYPIFKNVCWEFYAYESIAGGNQVRLSGNTINPWSGNSLDQIVEIRANNQEYGAFIMAENDFTVDINIPFALFDVNPVFSIYQRTDYFDIFLVSNGFEVTNQSPRQRFLVDWTSTRYGNIELYFIDRLGSLIPVNFTLQNTTNINIQRSEYQTLPGDLINPGPTGRWQFSSPQRGKRTLSTQATRSIDLKSDWLREEDVKYLQELFTSPLVYIKENDLLWPVIVRTDSFQVLNKKNKKNIQIGITIELANKDSIQQF